MDDDVQQITTDTAAICVFDPAAMAHRKDDVGDWWSIPRDQVAEINLSNALIASLGTDGTYEIRLTRDRDEAMPGYCLASPSGVLFVGPGEEMSGGGFEPDGEWGGFFISVEMGHQKVSLARAGEQVSINCQPTEFFSNNLTMPIWI